MFGFGLSACVVVVVDVVVVVGLLDFVGWRVLRSIRSKHVVALGTDVVGVEHSARVAKQV